MRYVLQQPKANSNETTVTDIQDGGVDKVRAMFQTTKKFVVREIQFVLNVALR